MRRANAEHHLPRGLLAHAEALWRCGKAGPPTNRSARPKTSPRAAPCRCTSRKRICSAPASRSPQGAADARTYRDRAAALIGKHGYGRAVPELAVLDAEIASAANVPAREAAVAAALTAVAGEPYHDARTGRTISGGWFGLLPRLEAILPPSHAASRSSKPPATPTTPSATIISARPSPRMWRATIPRATPSPPTSLGVEAGGVPPHPCPSPRGEKGPLNYPQRTPSPFGERAGVRGSSRLPPKVKKPSNPPTSPVCLTRRW